MKTSFLPVSSGALIPSEGDGALVKLQASPEAQLTVVTRHTWSLQPLLLTQPQKWENILELSEYFHVSAPFQCPIRSDTELWRKYISPPAVSSQWNISHKQTNDKSKHLSKNCFHNINVVYEEFLSSGWSSKHNLNLLNWTEFNSDTLEDSLANQSNLGLWLDHN